MRFRLIYRFLLLVIFLFLLVAACEKEVPERNIEAEILDLMEAEDLPSLSAAVVTKEGIVWQLYEGFADVNNEVPASEQSIYHIASISKLFIATAIMQLEEQGKLDIDDDINFYLPVDIRNPYFPETSITLRMLLTHSAGIAWPQTYIEAKELWEHFPPDQAPAPSEWVPQFLVPEGEYYNPRIWKNTEPGSFEYYSNIGTNVIAYVIEQVSGQNFRTYCREFIFLPLDMLNTSYNYGDLDESKLAKLYRDNNLTTPFFDDRIYAAGGLKTSVPDLSIFMRAYMNGGSLNGIKILNSGTVSRIMEMQNPVSGVCLLWRKSVGNWYGHTGGMEGAATAADIQFDDGIGMIVFTNKHNGIVYPGHQIYGLVRQKANEFRK